MMKVILLLSILFALNVEAATREENLLWADQVAATGTAAQFKVIMLAMWKANLASMDDQVLDLRVSTIKAAIVSATQQPAP